MPESGAHTAPPSAPRSATRRRVGGAVAVLTLAALAAACGTSGTSSSAPSNQTSTSAPPTTAASGGSTASTTYPPVSQPSPPGTWGKKPTVTVPTGAPPTQLEVSDLITGTGAVAKAGDTVTVQYVGVSMTTKQQFDASWNPGRSPFSFTLGAGQVIKGWDLGVAGMRVGGRRELVIPPDLAYGSTVPPGSTGIAPNDTLIFVVDLLSVS